MHSDTCAILVFAIMSDVDTRLLGRPSTFGGAKAEWPDWSFSMRAYGAAIDAAFLGAMEVASRATAPVLVTTLGVPEQNVARQLFFMLAMMTKGPALAIVRLAEINGGGPNGLEAWRLLVRRYQPEASTRTLGLLQQILNPVPFPDNATGFEEALSKWELTISRWESSSHDALNFKRSRVDPCLWTNSERVRIGRHMDDFIKTGPPVAVEAVTEYLERVAQLKVTGVLDKFGKQARFLGSFITKVHGGYTIQTDTETMFAGLRDLNLEHCKPSKLPGANPRTHDFTALETSEHKLYRRVVGRFLYCSAHRGDLFFRSISCAVVFNPRQLVTCRHCGNLHDTSKGLCTTN